VQCVGHLKLRFGGEHVVSLNPMFGLRGGDFVG
jgi:hypothetical protein